MKKIFSFMLMAMLCTVMAWGKDAHVSTIADLSAKLSDESIETIYLDADLTYSSEACINILRSVTIDGQGHKISGGGIRTGSTKSTMAINQGAPDNGNWIDLVTLKNLTLQNAISAGQALNVRCNLTKLVIENCTIITTGSGNNQPITFGGNQSAPVDVTINDSYISSGQAGYPLITFNPIALTTSNTTYKGYCALYFKGVNSSAGSGGSSVTADNCDFDAPNMNPPAGGWNSFGVFAIADGGITFDLNNCGFNSQETGSDEQQVFMFKYEGAIASIDPCIIHVTGDNSHINGHMLRDAQTSVRPYFQENYDPNAWNHVIEISGGTYAEDPSTVTSGDLAITISTGYEVSEVKQGDVTLYRVVKKAEEKAPGVKYDLNDDVPTDEPGAGNNPASSFDLSTGEDMTLNQKVTTAGYVQVKDHATEGATTVIVDKTAGGDKQRLIINNGLDVQGESSVEVKPGAAIIVGEGGINTEDPSNIVIESTEEAQGVLLLDPTITVNQNPELTVKLKTHSKLNAKKSPTKWEYTYQRFAIPVMLATAGYVSDDFDPEKNEFYDDEEEAVGFESYVWQWTGMQWETTTWNALERSIGYQLSNNSKNGDVTYTFTGNLIGNTNTLYEFDVKGFKFFGNSYTAPIMIEELLKGFKEIYPDVEASVWVYNYANKGWKSVNLDDIADGFAYATTIKSMDGFILNLRSANSGVAGVDYTSAIWNNPDINPKATPAPARRSNASAVSNSVVINVTSANFADEVTFVEREDRDLSFENGADASKFMNENGLNIYAETPAGTLSRVATDNLLGTQITFDAENDNIYTLSFGNVRGSSYALRDNVTEKVIGLVEGETYTFTQAANTSVKNRFEIVASYKMPTAVENVETSAKTKGIYTILGQYMGETTQWSTLPAGVYVVDGVKVVK